jgi:hypothetical protein
MRAMHVCAAKPSGSAPSSAATNVKKVDGALMRICSESGHTAKHVSRCKELIARNHDYLRGKDADGRSPLHVLCESPGHTAFSVEICMLLLQIDRRIAIARAKRKHERGTGLIPLQMLCMCPTLNEHSVEMARVLLVAFPGGADATTNDGVPCTTLVCRTGPINEHTVALFDRLAEVCMAHSGCVLCASVFCLDYIYTLQKL